MKLSQYAQKVGITYRTAWFWYKAGQIKGYQMPTGTIVITEDETTVKQEKVAIYARVSSSEHKLNLETQADRLAAYCAAKGWQVQMVIKEVGSGVNDSRDKLLKLLADTSITIIVVEHKDRLTRFGFNYISTLLESQSRRIEVVNLTDNLKEDLLGDLTSIIYSFCARLYGLRKALRKTELITKQLKDNNDATG